MVLRLILVSIVAGLGAAPPAESEISAWSYTVQAWLDERLTEWSICLSIAEAAPAPPAATEPGIIPSDDEFLVLFGDELAVPAPARKLDTETQADPGVITLDDLDALFVLEPAAAPPQAIEDVGAADREFEAVVDEMIADFIQGEGEQVATDRETGAQTLVTGQAEIDELEQAFLDAQAESEFAQAFTNPFVPAPAMTAVRAFEDDYFEIGDNVEFGSSPRSAQPAEPIDAPAPALEEAPPVCHPSASDPLRDAVRLTREAAYAWISLLQNPAIATLPE